MSTSFDKNVALEFAFSYWNNSSSKILVLIEIELTCSMLYFGLDELEIQPFKLEREVILQEG